MYFVYLVVEILDWRENLLGSGSFADFAGQYAKIDMLPSAGAEVQALRGKVVIFREDRLDQLRLNGLLSGGREPQRCQTCDDGIIGKLFDGGQQVGIGEREGLIGLLAGEQR